MSFGLYQMRWNPGLYKSNERLKGCTCTHFWPVTVQKCELLYLVSFLSLQSRQCTVSPIATSDTKCHLRTVKSWLNTHLIAEFDRLGSLKAWTLWIHIHVLGKIRGSTKTRMKYWMRPHRLAYRSVLARKCEFWKLNVILFKSKADNAPFRRCPSSWCLQTQCSSMHIKLAGMGI